MLRVKFDFSNYNGLDLCFKDMQFALFSYCNFLLYSQKNYGGRKDRNYYNLILHVVA